MSTIGVCSWSLRPTGPEHLARTVRACGLNAVQIALDPIRRGDWNERETAALMKREGIAMLSGMMAMRGEDYSTLETIKHTGGVRSDEHWPENLAAAHANAALAQRLGLNRVTFHAGFLPHDAGDPLRRVMLDRLRLIADVFATYHVAVAFETGQESATTLLDVLHELNHPSIGVNFDPANMILYGMGNPIAALQDLAPRVSQIHIKDARAVATSDPASWKGEEVAAGCGDVNWPVYMRLVRERLSNVNLLIERESRMDEAQKIADIRTAATMVRTLLKSTPQ